jgi:hypothetical protein
LYKVVQHQGPLVRGDNMMLMCTVQGPADRGGGEEPRVCGGVIVVVVAVCRRSAGWSWKGSVSGTGVEVAGGHCVAAIRRGVVFCPRTESRAMRNPRGAAVWSALLVHGRCWFHFP